MSLMTRDLFMEMHGTMNYTPYELSALREIESWESKGSSMEGTALDVFGVPVRAALKKIPFSTREAIRRAMEGSMEMLKDVSYWTYSEKRIVKRANKLNINITGIPELAEKELEALDVLARESFTGNRILAALQGAGCGAGGPVLIIADIPALFTLGFRTVQQIGSSYGFDMRSPAMTPVVMGIYHAGSGISVAAKSLLLADISRIASTGMASAPLAGSLLSEMMKQTMRVFPVKIAEKISSRKFAQMIPVAGALVGASFNYWFMSELSRAAFMIFRKLYLERKYASPHGTHVRKSLLSTLRNKLNFFPPLTA